MTQQVTSEATHKSFCLALLLLLVSIPALATCSSDEQASNTIGPAGGTVSDPGGASVTVPPGALSEAVEITVKTFQDPESGPYPTGPLPNFWGGLELGPSGTEFDKPVTITFPTRQPLNPGGDYQLFVYDPDEQRWENAKRPLTVNPDGTTLQGQVSHFSVFNGGGFEGGSAARSDITGQACEFGSAEALCRAYEAYFKEYVADVGDEGVYDGECKEVVGLYMDISCDVNGVPFFLPVRDGTLAGEADQISVYDPDDCADGDDSYALLDAFATIYYECSHPKLSAAADPSQIELGGSSTVLATLKCGEMVFPSQTVSFRSEGVGEIDRTSAATNPAGQAQVLYTNDDKEGQATVTASYEACVGKDNAATITGSATVTTGGGWSGMMNVNYDHPIGGAPLDLFSDAVTINFDFTIDRDGNISGTGTGSHSVDITAGEDCWVSSTNAPGFNVVVYGSATDETMNILLAPSPTMAVSFVITCPHDGDPQDYPYPLAEGLIEGAILTENISINVARMDGATDAGSGSRSDGTDIPMHFSWSVTVNQSN